jgi:hypothetical protein
VTKERRKNRRTVKVPKLVVMVYKDDTGKLWNYIFTEEEWAHNQNSLGTTPQWVHKSGSLGNSSQPARPTELTEEDHVTLGLLPLHEEARAHTRTKKK